MAQHRQDPNPLAAAGHLGDRGIDARGAAFLDDDDDDDTGDYDAAPPFRGFPLCVYTWHQLASLCGLKCGFLGLSLIQNHFSVGAVARMQPHQRPFAEFLEHVEAFVASSVAKSVETIRGRVEEEFHSTAKTNDKAVDKKKLQKAQALQAARYEVDLEGLKAALIKNLDKIESSQPRNRTLRIVVIGRTNVGKTTLINGLTGSCRKTAVKGFVEIEVLEGIEGSWTNSKGVRYDIELIDTPGVDDKKDTDQATFQKLEALFTERADIDAVLMVANGQAPVFDEAIIKQLRKYQDIFGAALRRNWAVLFSKWYASPEQAEMREENGATEENLIANTTNTLKEKLGFAPQKFFFADSAPRLEYQLETCKAYDALFSWLDTIEPIQTKDFLSKTLIEQAHLRNMSKLQHWAKFKVEASKHIVPGNLILELRNTSTAFVRTIMHFGLRGWEYDVNHFHFEVRKEDLGEAEIEDLDCSWAGVVDGLINGTFTSGASQRSRNLRDTLDRLTSMADLYLHDIKTEVVEDTSSAKENERHTVMKIQVVRQFGFDKEPDAVDDPQDAQDS
eukprot:m.68653 g.68653  ORF g.68653 m.68653 type:complete len:561 (+) comp7757_c0_seq1:1-1683(+)